MRLLERDARADSSTGSAWVPMRITQASNFSEASRAALSEVIDTVSIPNWRKHSDSRFLDVSCRSTNAARAENFLEGNMGEREFPKAVSVYLYASKPYSGAGNRSSQQCRRTIRSTKVPLPEVTRSMRGVMNEEEIWLRQSLSTS